ncbi:hypothetical protein AAG570_012712 [Ranatra chinensis]|uniref:Histone-lysine N-methyltransferase SETMAR n=1 Tax=Ranatra chinensis TaxID=642074 RepID=A0ABD0YEN1_9HEMI
MKGMLNCGVSLLHDNSKPHTAHVTQDLLVSFGWDIVTHPPYYSDLVWTHIVDLVVEADEMNISVENVSLIIEAFSSKLDVDHRLLFNQPIFHKTLKSIYNVKIGDLMNALSPPYFYRLSSSSDSSDMNYDQDSSTEDGDHMKLVRTNELRARDDRPCLPPCNVGFGCSSSSAIEQC